MIHRICVVALLLLSFNLFATQSLTPQEVFVDDVVNEVKLSPSGKYLAYTIPKDNSEIVVILDTETNKQTFSFYLGDNKFIAEWYWANDERLLFKPAVKSARSEKLFYVGTLNAVNFDGSKNKTLWGYKGRFGSGSNDQFDHPFDLESLLIDDPEHIMLSSYENAESTRVLRYINIYSGRVINRERSKTRKATFVINPQGEAVAQVGILESWDDEILYKNKEGDWAKLENPQYYDLISSYDEQSLLLRHYATGTTTQLIKFNRLTQEKEILATMENTGTRALRWNRDNEVIAFQTDKGKPEMHYLNPLSPEAQFHKALKNTFKGKYARELDRSIDGNKRLIKVSSDTEPGAFYMYNHAKRSLNLLIKKHPQLDRSKFSEKLPISFTARDGVEINGYLTTPKFGQSPAPTVVLVHGGPFGVRDYWDYDTEVQLLASHGYNVLQINFRGSGGYGISFERSGYRQWGKAMQDDITDGTLWAIKNGVADKERICIYGASYGGYSALMGVVKEPDLYKCAIGYVGVYDLPLKFSRGDVQERAEGMSYIKETMGTDKADLIAHSPAYNVDKIKAELMLVHGELDYRVPVEHYEALTDALDKRGYPYESILKKGELHGFNSNENKIELYSKLLKFLDKHIGKPQTLAAN